MTKKYQVLNVSLVAPLAIVVVGGLVTRPLKIVILPMVYEWIERRAARRAEATVA